MKEVIRGMLNIRPLHGDFRSCIEDVIVSVASWWERNHELMYAEAWNFRYTPWDPVLPNTIGRRLSEGEDKTWSYLARFHGIFLKYQKDLFSPSEALRLIENEIVKGHPVMVYVNDFWCPWRKFYQIEHQIQPCLVVGIEVSDSQLICIDPYSTLEFKVFPIDKFMNAYKNCVTFTKGHYADVDERVEDIIRLSAEKLLEYKEHGNKFDNMRSFAFDIENTLDMNLEMQGSTFSSPRSQLLNTLKYMARRRRQYSVFIRYTAKRYGLNISNYCNEMDIASQQWNIITNLFLKMHYMQDWYISRKNIANKIREAADFEEGIANSLLNSLNSYKLK